jgi:hypothetical protein
MPSIENRISTYRSKVTEVYREVKIPTLVSSVAITPFLVHLEAFPSPVGTEVWKHCTRGTKYEALKQGFLLMSTKPSSSETLVCRDTCLLIL